MLTDAQRRSYDQQGYVVVRGAVSAADCAAMGDRLWRALEDVHAIRRDEPATWRLAMPRGLGKRCEDAFSEVGCPAVIELLDGLLGHGRWQTPRAWAQPLPLFPTPGSWDVPSRMWHVDYPVRDVPEPVFAVKMLCLLAPVEPRGGGTLLLAGSHRVFARYAAAGKGGNSADVRKRVMRDHSWFRDLMSPGDGSDRVRRFMSEGTVIHGVPLEVAEFTGGAGDVVLFHPWLLHNVSPNCRDTPRLMVGQNLTTPAGLSLYQASAAGAELA